MIPSLKYLIHDTEEHIPGNVTAIILVIFQGSLRFKDILVYEPNQQLNDRYRNLSIHPDEAVNIQFTSGTTGRPKVCFLRNFTEISRVPL